MAEFQNALWAICQEREKSQSDNEYPDIKRSRERGEYIFIKLVGKESRIGRDHCTLKQKGVENERDGKKVARFGLLEWKINVLEEKLGL